MEPLRYGPKTTKTITGDFLGGKEHASENPVGRHIPLGKGRQKPSQGASPGWGWGGALLMVLSLQEPKCLRLGKAIQQQGQRVRCQEQNFPEPEPRSIVTMAKRGKQGPREAAGFSEDENRQSL